MKIICDLPNYLLSDIRKLIENGKYSSFADFVLIASENQLSLELEEQPNLLELTMENSRKKSFRDKQNYAHPMKNIATLDQIENNVSEHIWENWLWGQINRLLPIKFAIRLLAIETAKLGQFPEKGSFNSYASNEARSFGLFLRGQDEVLSKARDEKLSTGFPIGDKQEKSLDRYWSHFIGYQRGDGSLTGALFDLGFANQTSNDIGDNLIGLTKAGVRFSQIINPVIDNKIFKKSLSFDECQFYINHIIENVSGEVSLSKILLELITNGVEKRDLLNVKLREKISSSDWSDGMISTQRAGAISRMYEIGLITKKKIGLEVRYLSTEMGNQFLRREK